MAHIAKLFLNGRSQAVRLPAEFRFNCKEVFIHRDPQTGDVVLSRKPGSWKDYFDLLKNVDIPKDFMDNIEDKEPQERELF